MTTEPHEGETQQGRLVLVLENQLTEASRASLKTILQTLPPQGVTMVSGLSRASVLQTGASNPHVFYNHNEYLTPEDACKLLPWKDVVLIAQGRIWRLTPS